jgi:hypothetical protein
VKTTLTVTVNHPAKLSAKRIAKLVNRLLDVGYSDAASTPGDFHDPDVSDLMLLSISKPKPIKETKV